ncbi:MAG TPA: histone H1/H5 family protein [Candidatus Saccharimonadales bacterium]|nr:histone H1/H5 family protein [Candidatus Saccharimonadales bacterium]
METFEQIVSPKSKRLIYLYGDAYNNLIKEGYSEKTLLSLPRTKAVKSPRNTKVLSKYPKQTKQKIVTIIYDNVDVPILSQLTGVNDTDTYILSFLDDKSLVQACRSNKRLNQLCKNNKKLLTRIKKYKYEEFIDIKRMIGHAIRGEQSRKGTTRPYIKKYLEANYKIEPTDKRINKTIKILLDEKMLIPDKHHAGHYRLSPEYKKWLDDIQKYKQKKDEQYYISEEEQL